MIALNAQESSLFKNYSEINSAFSPVKSSQRLMMTSTYFGSYSITQALRPSCSQAMIVVPLPPSASLRETRLLAFHTTFNKPNCGTHVSIRTKTIYFPWGCRYFFDNTIIHPPCSCFVPEKFLICSCFIPILFLICSRFFVIVLKVEE